MRPVERDLVTEVICQKFYVEKLNKSQIAKLMGLARNTVKKHLKDNPPESDFIQSLLKTPLPTVPEPLRQGQYHFPSFQLALHNATKAGDTNLKELDLLKVIKNHADYLGISSQHDFLKLEMAYEQYLLYKSFSKRLVELNGQCLDVSWVNTTDKMTKFITRYAEAVQKCLNTHMTLIKELEIKYGRRSPDLTRIHNLNIQRNEINLASSCD